MKKIDKKCKPLGFSKGAPSVSLPAFIPSLEKNLEIEKKYKNTITRYLKVTKL